MKNILIIILLLLSNCLFAQTKIDSLEALLPNKQGLEKVELLNKLSYEYWNVSSDKGLEYAQMAYQIALKEDNKLGIAKSLQNIGINYWVKSELHLALENHQKSLKIYEDLNDIYGISVSYCNMGIVYDDLADYENALKYFFKSMNNSEDNEFTELYITNMENISSVYLAQKNYPKALEYVQEAIDLSKKQGITSNLANHLNTLAVIYEFENNYKKAKSIYKKALLLFRKSKNNFGTIIVLYNIGQSEYKLKNYDSAIEYFNESLIISEKFDDQIGVLLANKSIGIIYKDQNRFDDALVCYKKAFDLAIELDLKEEKLEFYELYSELYKSIGEFNKSLVYLEAFVSLKDSIYNKNSSKQIAEMQTKYDSEKKEKENELLRKNSEIQDLAIAKQTNLRNSFIGLLVLVILMIIILLNRFKIKKKANLLLIEKNKVISTQRDELKETNSTKDKFFSIISHDLRSPFNSILGITNILVDDYDEIDEAEKRKLIILLNKSSHSAYDLLANLLSWALTQTERIEINKELLNLKDLVETNVAPYMLNASEKDIKIIINVPPEIKLLIDRNTSMTIIGNLINNAIKFTPEGGTITINFYENKDNIALHIIDTGVGMTSEVIEKLFKIDEDISTKGTNNETGTGLGLILCKEFVEKNGGNIKVESEIGKGSKFIITLFK